MLHSQAMEQKFLASVVKGFRTLFLDSSCIGCGISSQDICQECEIDLAAHPEQIMGENFKIFASLIYGKTESRIVLAAKEDGNRLARRILANAITKSITELLRGYRKHGEIILVPIPSAASAIRRRGGEFLQPIIREVVSNLQQDNPGFVIASAQVLRINRRVKDQSKLSESERVANLRFAFELTGKLPRSPIVLVDDVVTTGSTLREAYRALQERNLTVLGAVTACASGRRMRIR